MFIRFGEQSYVCIFELADFPSFSVFFRCGELFILSNYKKTFTTSWSLLGDLLCDGHFSSQLKLFLILFSA